MKKYFILAAAVLTMTACSNDENENSVINDNAINLTASVAGATATRAGVAVQSTYFEAGELINVECTPNDGTTDGTMVSAVYETGAAATSTTINALSVYTGSTALTWPAKGTVSLKAFYPYDVTSSQTTFSVLEDQSTDATNPSNVDANYKASDLMYSTPITGQTKQSAAVELTFHHALTKIIVNLTPGSGMTNDDVAACTVKLYAKKTVAIASGVASTDPGDATEDAEISAGKGEVIATSEQGVKTYGVAAIIVPQTITVQTDPELTPVDFITVTTAGNHSVTYKLGETKAFAAGNVYTYNFTVGISGLILQSTQIIDWVGATTNVINGGPLTL